MQAAFLTGINGFVGRWFTKLLLAQNYAVYGIDLQQACFNPTVHYTQSDLLNEKGITDLIASVTPELIINLAAVTFLPDADLSPRKAIDANITGTMIILDAVKNHSPQSRVLLIGSSREYPKTTSEQRIHEDMISLYPATFYGISKLSSECIGLQYGRQFGIDVRCTRSFNHTGPGQSPHFVCSEWAKTVAQIEHGIVSPQLSVGNLNTILDFSDVRDVVNAYYLILTVGKSGTVYNVCSGTGTDLQWILSYLTAKSSTTIEIVYPPEHIRERDSDLHSVGDHSKLSHDTGWKPNIPLSQTLDNLYSWWYEKLVIM